MKFTVAYKYLVLSLKLQFARNRAYRFSSVPHPFRKIIFQRRSHLNVGSSTKLISNSTLSFLLCYSLSSTASFLHHLRHVPSYGRLLISYSWGGIQALSFIKPRDRNCMLRYVIEKVYEKNVFTFDYSHKLLLFSAVLFLFIVLRNTKFFF